MSGKLFIISAPSGAGKTSLVKVIVERLGAQFSLERLVTYTTKSPGNQEVQGVDYHFVSVQEFEQKINEGFFVEWSTAYGAHYGSPGHIELMLTQGKSIIVVVDQGGAQKMAASFSRAVLIWIQPPNLSVLRERLILRARDQEAEINKRLEIAQRELAEDQKKSLYKYRVINENFQDTVQKLQEIFLAEFGERISERVD